MKNDDVLGKNFARLEKWLEKSGRIIERKFAEIETLYNARRKELDEERVRAEANVKREEERIKGELEQAGKEYAQKKYHLERDAANHRTDILKADEDFHSLQKNQERELNRLNEEKTNLKISYDRQMSALTDLYQEKRRQLLTAREKISTQWKKTEETDKVVRQKNEEEFAKVAEEQEKKLAALRNQLEAKQQGWNLALETIRREAVTLAEEKEALLKKLSTVREEKEKDIQALQVSLQVSREQLELDKATLIEKAEADQRRCEQEIQEINGKILNAESELQNFITSSAQRQKDAEEIFQKEEASLKEAVKIETEKRDYEQKLFQQEKTGKEKEINELREDYERRKSQCDNQIKSLMMQKSVQEAQHEAERMRVDREARVVFRTLEAKRDELKTRLADLKSRHAHLTTNAEKEKELMNQRWQWRRDRLWSMWQSRLETLKKERLSLQEQLTQLLDVFAKEKSQAQHIDKEEEVQVDELRQFVLQVTERNEGSRRSKEIQFELEKTRIVAQIKECETLIVDWMDRIKLAQDSIAKSNVAFSGQMESLDRWFKDEEKETELFLHDLRKAMSELERAAQDVLGRQNAA